MSSKRNAHRKSKDNHRQDIDEITSFRGRNVKLKVLKTVGMFNGEGDVERWIDRIE